MPKRNADAAWEGDLKSGKGTMKFGSGAFEGNYSFASRFEDGKGTNPEELIGAAHAGCFSMALSADLGKNGYEPKKVETHAEVTIENVDGGFKITKIDLTTKAEVPGIDQDDFNKFANGAKENCPVSQALAGVTISLNATLL